MFRRKLQQRTKTAKGKKPRKESRRPDVTHQFTNYDSKGVDEFGIAVWHEDSGLHDIRVGPSYALEDDESGEELLMLRTVVGIDRIPDLLEGIRLAAEVYSTGHDVPTSVRTVLGDIAARLDSVLGVPFDEAEEANGEATGNPFLAA